MSKTESHKKMVIRALLKCTPAVVVIALVGICIGLFFIFSQGVNKPIQRKEAVSHSGVFDRYEIAGKNYKTIYFSDGSSYQIYPHTESKEFRERMTSLKKGTKLYILVNPLNDYTVEVRTDTEELLNFELSQEEIDSYDNGYIIIGVFICVAGVLLIVYAAVAAKNKRKENARWTERKSEIQKDGENSVAIRYADETDKSKILLEAETNGYRICYRRVKSVNELVINGKVYDEKKGIIEFSHKLCAVLDGHFIEAGLDENDCSYIIFDGKMINSKKRRI